MYKNTLFGPTILLLETIRQRNARIGRNPKSGQKVDVPSKKVPFFKAGKELRELVDEQSSDNEQENQGF